MKSEEIALRIYKEIFCHTCDTSIDIFLCGGAKTKSKVNRDAIRRNLENYGFLFNIFYPEDLFIELLNKKEYDLLSLEKYLADNSDYIVIVCESMGSAAELGAFVNNVETFSKVIVLQDLKFKNIKSFISEGPIKYLKKKYKNHVLYYKNNSKKIASQLKYILKKEYSEKKKYFKDIDCISGQCNYILFLLYLFDSIERTTLCSYIENVNKIKDSDLSRLYQSSLNRLFNTGLIQTNNENRKHLELTKKGIEKVEYMIENNLLISYRKEILNDIRIKIMYNEYYKTLSF